MRKINPADVCDDFRNEISALETFLTDSWNVAASSRDKSFLAELVFHRAYVAVESFLSAWIIGAINRDSSQFIANRTNAITQSLTSKFSAWDATQFTYSPPSHITVSDLQTLVDPDGWNITFKTYDKLKAKCAEWLTDPYKNKVDNVPVHRQKVIDAAKAVRNCIAHQSQSSFTDMNQQIGGLPNTGVCRHLRTTVNSVTNVGSHLKAVAGTSTRVQLYLEEFREFGSNLR
jgi:hypothetical protein